MFTTIATLLIAFAASDPGSIAASLARHAADARLERVDSDPAWSRLKRLAPATDIVISTDSGAVNRVFVSATDNEITVINRAATPACPDTSVLVDVARQRPELFDRAHIATGFIVRDVEVRGDRILGRGTSGCRTDAVVERISRKDIHTITSPRMIQSSSGWTVAGVALGFIAGGYTGVALCMDRPTGSAACGAAGIVALGMPIAGGIVGHFATRHPVKETYYTCGCDRD